MITAKFAFYFCVLNVIPKIDRQMTLNLTLSRQNGLLLTASRQRDPPPLIKT